MTAWPVVIFLRYEELCPGARSAPVDAVGCTCECLSACKSAEYGGGDHLSPV